MYKDLNEIVTSQADLRLEEHSVVTDDGYILKLFRVAKPAVFDEWKGDKPSTPILFMHGVDDSADAWIIHEEQKAPAFIAARAGFDVWMGNWRGNKYSRQHESLDPNDDAKEFFDFTFTTIADHDLPSIINYIKESTNAPKLAYIAHSMGTSVMYVAMAKRPEFIKENVSIFIALGPVAKVSHSTSSLIRHLAGQRKIAERTLDFLGIYELNVD